MGGEEIYSGQRAQARLASSISCTWRKVIRMRQDSTSSMAGLSLGCTSDTNLRQKGDQGARASRRCTRAPRAFIAGNRQDGESRIAMVVCLNDHLRWNCNKAEDWRDKLAWGWGPRRFEMPKNDCSCDARTSCQEPGTSDKELRFGNRCTYQIRPSVEGRVGFGVRDFVQPDSGALRPTAWAG